MGGADVAWANDPLGAMGANPAGLSSIPTPTLTLGGVGGIVEGHFSKSNGSSEGNLNSSLNALPFGAFAMPVGKLDMPVTVGLSFIPESALLANWNYRDPAGGLGGVSYGYQRNLSEIITLRSALGASVQFTPEFSFGASVGLIYNDNRLQAPYIFQHLQPGSNSGVANGGLNGAKTLLNLHTSGLAFNAQFGFIYKITPDLQFGASYESESTVVSTGSATGDPSLQFGAPPGTLPFRYDASVTNTFPQVVRAGFSWKFQPQWRAAVQVDWIDWSDAFKNLPLTFKNGSNPGVNAALGNAFTESIPLNWQSQFVYRTGIEYTVNENWIVRGGYSYGGNPVPSSTLTPLNAAIMEHTFTCGVGYHYKQYDIDLGYQYYLPATENIGTSRLRSQEYSNSSIEVSAHEIALSTTVHF